MSTSHEAFEAHYQRSAEDPASAEMLAVWEAAWKAAVERAAALCADVDEPAWYGFECPYSFQDGKVACIAAIRAQTGGEHD